MTAITNIYDLSIFDTHEVIFQKALALLVENQNLKSTNEHLEFCLEMDRILMEKTCHINSEDLFCEINEEISYE